MKELSIFFAALLIGFAPAMLLSHQLNVPRFPAADRKCKKALIDQPIFAESSGGRFTLRFRSTDGADGPMTVPAGLAGGEEIRLFSTGRGIPLSGALDSDQESDAVLIDFSPSSGAGITAEVRLILSAGQPIEQQASLVFAEAADPKALQPLLLDLDGNGIDELVIYDSLAGLGRSFRFQTGRFLESGAQQAAPDGFALGADTDGDCSDEFVLWKVHAVDPGVAPIPAFLKYRTGSELFDAIPFGLPGDIPLSADFDCDAKADFAVYRRDSAAWFLRLASTAPASPANSAPELIHFGTERAVPFAGDFDQDGCADAAYYSRANRPRVVIRPGRYRPELFGVFPNGFALLSELQVDRPNSEPLQAYSYRKFLKNPPK